MLVAASAEPGMVVLIVDLDLADWAQHLRSELERSGPPDLAGRNAECDRGPKSTSHDPMTPSELGRALALDTPATRSLDPRLVPLFVLCVMSAILRDLVVEPSSSLWRSIVVRSQSCVFGGSSARTTP